MLTSNDIQLPEHPLVKGNDKVYGLHLKIEQGEELFKKAMSVHSILLAEPETLSGTRRHVPPSHQSVNPSDPGETTKGEKHMRHRIPFLQSSEPDAPLDKSIGWWR